MAQQSCRKRSCDWRGIQDCRRTCRAGQCECRFCRRDRYFKLPDHDPGAADDSARASDICRRETRIRPGSNDDSVLAMLIDEDRGASGRSSPLVNDSHGVDARLAPPADRIVTCRIVTDCRKNRDIRPRECRLDCLITPFATGPLDELGAKDCLASRRNAVHRKAEIPIVAADHKQARHFVSLRPDVTRFLAPKPFRTDDIPRYGTAIAPPSVQAVQPPPNIGSIRRIRATAIGGFTMKSRLLAFSLCLAALAAPATAQTKLTIGYSGWTGFAPLTLAKEAGIFQKNGLDVTMSKIPQASRHLAIQSGQVACAATTVETWVVWNANGVATKQIFQLDKSYGADGMVVRNSIQSIKDLKGKTVAASAPGTAPYFTLAWFLKKNGLSVKDVTVVNLEPGPAAQVFIAGQNDAAMTYEPYLSSVRAAPQAGKIIATTLDYPMIMDTFGCTPKFLADNPKAGKALADSYFQALEMIAKEQAKAYEIMGADVKQSGAQFGESAKYLRWQDRAANKKFFESEFKTFSEEAANLLLEIGIIKAKPDMGALADTRFIQ